MKSFKLQNLIFVIFLSSLFFFSKNSFASNNPFKLSGYYKNIFNYSKTISTKEDYYADTNRLRLQGDYKFNDNLSTCVIYDHMLMPNDFENTPDFDLVRQQQQKFLTAWGTDKIITDQSNFYEKQLIYRAFFKYVNEKTNIVLGKQAIDWSRMKFYHPWDIFNPISPLDIEKDEKIGIDAINADFFPTSLSSINIIYAPYKNNSRAGYGLKLSKKIADYDLSFIASQYRKERIFGIGFDGYIKDAGFRGEITTNKNPASSTFARVSVGMDYNFTPKLYALAEYFYNGGAAENAQSFLNSYELSRQAMTIKKNIAGAGVEYALTGITKLATYLFYDFEGRSIFANPEIRCNATTNLDLILGVQFFNGNSDSEYGNYHNLVYSEVKYYF